jgi:hypothetical protein
VASSQVLRLAALSRVRSESASAQDDVPTQKLKYEREVCVRVLSSATAYLSLPICVERHPDMRAVRSGARSGRNGRT